jgi:hypothetical protein
MYAWHTALNVDERRKKSDKKNITYIYRVYSILCLNVLPTERGLEGETEIDKLT